MHTHRRLLPLVALTVTAAAAGYSQSDAETRIQPRDARQQVVPVISARPADSARWSLTVERTIQPPDGDTAELLDPADLALGDDGTLAVAESKPAQVKVFGPDGRFMRTIGRPGDGPGEFQVAFIALRADTLVVHDPSSSRTSLFNLRTGAFLSSRTTVCCTWYPIGLTDDGRAIVRSIARSPGETGGESRAFARFSLTGARAETTFIAERHALSELKVWPVREGTEVRMTVPAPMQPRNYFALQPDGSFLTGWSGEYQLRVTRSGRDTAALFGRRITPARITSADKRALVEARIAETRKSNAWAPEATLRAAFDPSLIPDTRPFYEGIAADRAGRRWIRLVSTDTTRVLFDVFDAQGRWLDIVGVAASGWPVSPYASVAWSRDRAAVALEDASGRPFVRIYRIARR
jgi:hypothetical protein